MIADKIFTDKSLDLCIFEMMQSVHEEQLDSLSFLMLDDNLGRKPERVEVIFADPAVAVLSKRIRDLEENLEKFREEQRVKDERMSQDLDKVCSALLRQCENLKTENKRLDDQLQHRVRKNILELNKNLRQGIPTRFSPQWHDLGFGNRPSLLD